MTVDGKDLAQHDVFRHVLEVPGAVVEIGVGKGVSFCNWVAISHALEIDNYARQFIGFDTFTGFPGVTAEDDTRVVPGDLNYGDPNPDFQKMLTFYSAIMSREPTPEKDEIGNKYGPRIHLIKGDVIQTVPEYCTQHPELVVALLFLDADLYAPTRVAIEHLWDRIPRGGVVVFDELQCRYWRGETQALHDTLGIGNVALRRVRSYPPWAYLVKE